MYRKIGFYMMLCLVLVLTPLAGMAGSEEKDNTTECPPCPCAEKSAPEVSFEDSEDNPEELTLNKKGETYGPVEFTHMGHNDYVDEGCVSCHHMAGKTGVIKPCAACHAKPLFQKAEQLNVLNLKAAFHKQCITCHEDNDAGPMGCTECHEIKKKKADSK